MIKVIKYEHHNNDCLNTILSTYSIMKFTKKEIELLTKKNLTLDFILKNQRFFQ